MNVSTESSSSSSESNDDSDASEEKPTPPSAPAPAPAGTSVGVELVLRVWASASKGHGYGDIPQELWEDSVRRSGRDRKQVARSVSYPISSSDPVHVAPESLSVYSWHIHELVDDTLRCSAQVEQMNMGEEEEEDSPGDLSESESDEEFSDAPKKRPTK